jgi:hypothetical protein
MSNKKILVGIVSLAVLLLTVGLISNINSYNKTTKKEKDVTSKDKLVCEQKNSDYSIKVTSKIENDEVSNIKILVTDNSSNMNSTKGIIQYYSSMVGSKYSSIDNETTIELTDETKAQYSNLENIKEMFSNYNTAKKYYESDGYTCK